MSKQKWEVKSHSYQIADTGDYDGYWEVTNGKISLMTKDDPDEDDVLNAVADALNKSECEFYIDDADKWLAHHYKQEMEKGDREIERLKAENERLKTPEAMREAIVEYYTWRVTSGWELHSSGEYYYRSKDRHQWPPEETCELHELFQHFLNDLNKATEALKTNTHG